MSRIPDDDDPINVLPVTDDLSNHYAQMAKTSSTSAEKEAAMQFVIAEDHIKEGETFEDAIRSANKALSLFRDIRNAVGVADSLRLIIHAYRLKADLLQQSTARRKEAIPTLKQAEEMANENAVAFRKLGDKRSEAAMLLSFAEVKIQSSANGKKKEAAKAAAEAQALCRKSGDRVLEAGAVMALCHIYLTQERGRDAVKAALEARTLFKAAKNELGEAKAMHALSMSRSSVGETLEAIGAARQAETLFRSLGLEKQASIELFHIARLCMEKGNAEESLQSIESLSETISTAASKGDDSYDGWSTRITGLKVQVMIAAERQEEAASLVQDLMSRFPAERDPHNFLFAIKASAREQFGVGAVDNAVKSVQEGLRVCRENGGDGKFETSLTFMAAEMLSSSGKSGDGVVWAGKARDEFRKVGDKLGEAKATFLLGQQTLRNKDPVAALRACQQGRTLALRSEQKAVEAAMILLSSKAHLEMGEEEEGMGAAQEAASIFHEVGDLRGEVEALKLAAAIYKANDENQEADETARRAQGRARDAGDKVSEIEILRWLAYLHAEQGHTKSALRAAKDAMRVGKNQDKKTQAETLLLVSEKYLAHLQAEAQQQPEPEKLIIAKANLVLKPGNEAVQMAKDIGDKKLACLGLIIQGQVANNVYRHEEALACYEEGLPIAQEIKDDQCEAACYILGAESRYALGRMDLASELAAKAAPLAAKVKDKDVQERCKRFVSTVTVRGGGGGGGRRRVKIGTKKVKKMVEKRTGGGGGGGKSLEIEPVRQMARGVFNTLAEDEISFDDPLMDSGIDSLSAITFRNELTKQTGMQLPGTVMFDFPTLGAVADFIVEESKSQGGGGGEAEQVTMVEEEVEESEYEWVDDDDYQPRSRRRKIGTKKVKKWVQKSKGGGGGGGGGGGLALADVKQMSMGVLNTLTEEAVGFDDPLMDSGIDSLSAITFRNELTKNTGMKLPGTLMFDFPTLGAVADYIVEESKGAGGGDGGGGDGGPAELEWVEEEVEESEYEDVEDDYGPPALAARPAPAAASAAAPDAVAVPGKKKGFELAEVQALVTNVMSELAEEPVSMDDPLMDSGLDSLSAITFRNKLGTKTGMTLPGTLMFDFPTLGGVAGYIVDASNE